MQEQIIKGYAGKKVLIIVENLPVPFDKRVWNEANTLTKAGYKVSIICPQGKGYTERYEVIDGISVYRHSLPSEGNGFWGYLKEYSAAFFWEFTLALKIFMKERFDVIHACNPPDNIFLIGAFFKMFGVKFVFDHHDITPELFIAKYGNKGRLYKLMLFLERMSFMTANISLATNNSYKRIAVERGMMNPDKVFIVRSGPDIKKMTPVDPIDELKEGKKYMVCYVGVMGRQEGIEYLLKAAKYMKNEKGRDDVKFVLMGRGPEFESLEREASNLGVSDVVKFTGRIPDKELIEYLSTADVCVNPDEANDMNDKSTMNKIMEYMALGKPIVQFDLTEGRFSAQDASLYAKGNDEKDMAEKIIELLEDPQRRVKMGECGRKRIEEELAWKYSEEILLEAYESLFTEDS